MSTDRQVPQRAVGVFPQQSPPSSLPPADRRHSPLPPAPPTPLTPHGHAREEPTAPTSSVSPCTRRASSLNAQKAHSLEKRPLLAFPAYFPRPLPPTVAVSPRAGTRSGGCGAPARGGRSTSGASSRTQCSKSALVPAVPAKPHIPAWDETVTTPPPQVTEPSSQAPGVSGGCPASAPLALASWLPRPRVALCA